MVSKAKKDLSEPVDFEAPVRQWKKVANEGEGKKIVFIKPSTLTEADIGTLFLGTFTAQKPNKFEEGNFDYTFEKEDGQIVVLNHTAHLATFMKKIPVGSFCKVDYLGKEAFKNKKTGKQMQTHQFEVVYE